MSLITTKEAHMGYDMYVQHESGKTLAEVQVPRSTEPKGDREAWLEWYDRRSSDEFYLRRNISGMPHLRKDLVAVGAVFEDYDFSTGWGHPNPHVMGREFPERPEPEEEHFSYDEETYEETPITDEAKAYYEAVEAHLRWRPERPGIPIHKLCDNSGWHVTKGECEEALEAIANYLLEHGELPCSLRDEYGDELEWDPWEDTLTFLRSAAEHDGFRVY